MNPVEFDTMNGVPARAILWLAQREGPSPAFGMWSNTVFSYDIEPAGKAYLPDDPRPFANWLNAGWRFAPFTYTSTFNNATVVVLEHR